MNDHEINIAVATACGWTRSEPHDYDAWADYPAGMDCRQRFWTKDGVLTEQRKLPDYANDLNAMHEAEKILDQFSQSNYWLNLEAVIWNPVLEEYPDANVTPENVRLTILFSTARQRSEAFLRTLNKWP